MRGLPEQGQYEACLNRASMRPAWAGPIRGAPEQGQWEAASDVCPYTSCIQGNWIAWSLPPTPFCHSLVNSLQTFTINQWTKLFNFKNDWVGILNLWACPYQQQVYGTLKLVFGQGMTQGLHYHLDSKNLFLSTSIIWFYYLKPPSCFKLVG